MNLFEAISLAPKILPLMPRIEKAIDTVQRLMADPDVKDALAVGAEVAKILDEQKSSTVAEKAQSLDIRRE
jgi:hypothetical protein